MQVGPAAQTLAAMRRLAHKDGKTFASKRVIADVACLPVRTVKRHLRELDAANWIENVGRKGRRTPTYLVRADMINQTNAKKYAILPRWAAKMLPKWSERAVFACIVSRDSLSEAIGNGATGGEDNFGRLQYPVKTLALDSGLSPRAIDQAKVSLAAQGIIEIDPAMLWRDDRGRVRTMADTLMLNPEFQVDDDLVDRSADLAPSNGIETPHRSADLAPTRRKFGTRVGADLALGGRKNGPCSESELLHESLKGISTSTASPSAAAVCVVEEADQGGEDGGGDGLAVFLANVRDKLDAPLQLEEAVSIAIGHNGCSLDDLRERVSWFSRNQFGWRSEHRPGVLYEGIVNAFPGVAPEKGWPYQRRCS